MVVLFQYLKTFVVTIIQLLSPSSVMPLVKLQEMDHRRQAPRGCSDVLWDAEREFPVAMTDRGAQDGRCMTGGVDDVFSYEVKQSDEYGWVVS